MAETLTILSVVSFLLAGAFGTASVVFWLWFDIPEIIGDLSGRAARRSARRIRKENVKAAGAREERARAARTSEERARAAGAREERARAVRTSEERARAERDATEHLEDIMIIHTNEVI